MHYLPVFIDINIESCYLGEVYSESDYTERDTHLIL